MGGALESARLVEDTVSKTAGAIALGGSIPSLSATPPPKPLSTKLKWEGPQLGAESPGSTYGPEVVMA